MGGPFFGGALAGLVSSLLGCPFNVVKVQIVVLQILVVIALEQYVTDMVTVLLCLKVMVAGIVSVTQVSVANFVVSKNTASAQ